LEESCKEGFEGGPIDASGLSPLVGRGRVHGVEKSVFEQQYEQRDVYSMFKKIEPSARRASSLLFRGSSPELLPALGEHEVAFMFEELCKEILPCLANECLRLACS
jgi:hypothetical protein